MKGQGESQCGRNREGQVNGVCVWDSAYTLVQNVRSNFHVVDLESSSSFPIILPRHTSLVQLKWASTDIFSQTPFKHASWHQVQELTLEHHCDDGWSNLSNNSLHGLHHLRVLRSRACISSLEAGVFLNTPEIETLDLSNNNHLLIGHVSKAIRSVLPNLKYLDISRIHRFLYELPVLGGEFTEFIRRKDLEVLNVSETNVVSLDRNFNYSSIHVLNISKNSMQWIPRGSVANMFLNLREIDISYSFFPMLNSLTRGSKLVFDSFCICPAMVSQLRYINAHDLILPFPLEVINGVCNASCELLPLEYIDISRSNIRWFNFSWNVVLFNLTIFRASQNSLEYISPKFLMSMPNLRELRLDRNNLSTMQYLSDFEDIFLKKEALEYLDISWNSFSFLPWKLFVSVPYLKELYLQGNRILYFHVETRYLYSLRVLDLSENGLTLISSEVLKNLDTITKLGNASCSNNSYTLNATYTETISISREHTILVVNLYGNMLDCSCENIAFLTWMTESKINFNGKSGYKCGQGFFIQEPDKDGIDNLVYYCNLQRNLPLIIVPNIIGCLLIMCVVLIKLYIYKRAQVGERRRKYVNDYLDLENERIICKDKRYPAFLSFCSVDDDVAKTYFYPTLKTVLKHYFGDKEVLATGETMFSPGKLIFSEIKECFSRCDVILFIVTLDFTESEWCRIEMDQADLQRKPTIYLVENTVLEQQPMHPCLKKLTSHTRANWKRERKKCTITPNWDTIAQQVLDFAAAAKRETGY
ncbi:hypothetical protein CHS0354_017608 [Potamilus streckersoni]|uniref:TIR domain-containing protein n=1 Tax=Potamilus streckersoni TaxID=2493646 RepID=A0AAE0VGN4_9BIVA|nr:hypothetical protein CHS0354_017608 [Potamilus streckersoni]